MNNKQAVFSLLKIPEDCDVIESTVNSLYKPPPVVETKITIETPSLPSGVSSNNKFIDAVKKMEERNKYQTIIQRFAEQFKLNKLREPTEDEVIDNLSSEVPMQFITSILASNEESNIKLSIDETV